jgi:hypothetical protein
VDRPESNRGPEDQDPQPFASQHEIAHAQPRPPEVREIERGQFGRSPGIVLTLGHNQAQIVSPNREDKLLGAGQELASLERLPVSEGARRIAERDQAVAFGAHQRPHIHPIGNGRRLRHGLESVAGNGVGEQQPAAPAIRVAERVGTCHRFEVAADLQRIRIGGEALGHIPPPPRGSALDRGSGTQA